MSYTAQTEVPAGRVPPIARPLAARRKSVAAVWLVISGLFALCAVGAAVDHLVPERGPLIGGIGFWVALFGWAGVATWRRARVIERAATVAETDELLWYVLGKRLVAAHPNGEPELSFKLPRRLRAQLLAAPAARVIQR